MPNEAKEHGDYVKASPTKRFFIAVLIKDIQFIDAVIELVDNSVDSARSAAGATGLNGIVIDITYTPETFCISDNAFGISLNVAKNYAFRFGRPDDAPSSPGSVGEFGVGMKRALFKIGEHFVVESHTDKEYFSVDVDVRTWQTQHEDDSNAWTFPIRTQGTNTTPSRGTKITVDKLYEYAVEEFSNSFFGTRLIALLREAHEASLASGLQITVNNISVHSESATLLGSDEIVPILNDQVIEIEGKKVSVKLIAGVGVETLSDAGWYIYCNGRLIERAEKTEKTGWNSAIDDGVKIPKPHWQFRRFRGYLFFESDSPDVLPWNTTKTGLNVEAPAYRRVRSDMNAAMTQVISFLNALDAEQPDGPLEASVLNAKPILLAKLRPNTSFAYTPSSDPQVRKQARISYLADPDLVDLAKDAISAKNNRELGELTFQYYIDGEGLDG